MSEKCKSCKEEFDSGIWLAHQFNDEKVLLFCSEECKEDYLNKKLRRIKAEYPKYYDKIVKSVKSAKNKDINHKHDKNMYPPFVEILKGEINWEDENG
ncbi:MAG: hypothetical protein AABX07_02540 [Nanoarchaeota archaeon]